MLEKPPLVRIPNDDVDTLPMEVEHNPSLLGARSVHVVTIKG